MDVRHGTFTPFVFSLTGGEFPETSMFHKHIAQKIANKTEEKYEKVQTLIRCKLSFLILRSVLLCIRGSRSISKDSIVLDDVSLTCSAAGLSCTQELVSLVYHILKVKCLFFVVSTLISPLYTGLVGFSSMCVCFFQPSSSQFVICQLPFLIFCCFGACMLVKSRSLLTVYIYMVI